MSKEDQKHEENSSDKCGSIIYFKKINWVNFKNTSRVGFFFHAHPENNNQDGRKVHTHLKNAKTSEKVYLHLKISKHHWM